jgi:hypothetical protein
MQCGEPQYLGRHAPGCPRPRAQECEPSPESRSAFPAHAQQKREIANPEGAGHDKIAGRARV